MNQLHHSLLTPEPMLLVPGTTLHDGKYVIDALLEDADNGALYWGTQIATHSSVYLQARTIRPEVRDSEADANHLSPSWLESTHGSHHPCCTGILDAFTDGQQSYLAMATQMGQPWSQRHRYSGPLPPKQALIRVKQAVAGWLWLREQGVATVDLSPNRVWWPDGDAPVILSGWLGANGGEANPLAAMATLLWQFLSGSTLKPPGTLAELRQYHPTLSPRILETLQLGLAAPHPSQAEAASALTAWLQSLPIPADGSAMLTQPESLPVAPLVAPLVETPPNDAPLTPAPVASSLPPPTRFSPGLALALTALIAALAGVGAGMAWRFAPSAQTPGGPRFSPDQGFPTLSNWAGDSP